jgi:hypothetical protein
MALAIEDGDHAADRRDAHVSETRQQRIETTRYVVDDGSELELVAGQTANELGDVRQPAGTRLPRPRRRVLGASLRSVVPLVPGTRRVGPEPTMRGTTMATSVALVAVRPGTTSDM